ncbi:hypothetical protein Tco_0029811 [Tanacetum coccineum]
MRSAVVPTTLSIAWKIPNKPLLNMHPRVPTKREVWICQISQEISKKRTRERMSDQEAKEIKAEAREIMPQPSTVNQSPIPLIYKFKG